MLRPWLFLTLALAFAATALVARALSWLLIALAVLAALVAAGMAWRRWRHRAGPTHAPVIRR